MNGGAARILAAGLADADAAAVREELAMARRAALAAALRQQYLEQRAEGQVDEGQRRLR